MKTVLILFFIFLTANANEPDMHNHSVAVQNKSANKVMLNTDEIEYLKKKEEIKMCVLPNSLPFSKIENSKHIGMSANYIELISKIIDTKFTLVPTLNWSQSLEYAQERKCDILPIAQETPSRKKYLSFSKTFFSVSMVIATKNDKIFIPDLNTVLEKKLGVLKGSSSVELLKSKYLNINIVEVENDKNGLDKVADGILYGYIGGLSSVAYGIQKLHSNELKINGSIGHVTEIGMAIRNDEIILLNILNKAISNIDEEQKQSIYNKWLSITYEHAIDYNLVKKLSVIFVFIVLIILFFLVRQNRLKNKIEILNRTLVEKINLATLDLRRAQQLSKVGSWRYKIEEDSLVWSDETYNIFQIDKVKTPIKSLDDFTSKVDSVYMKVVLHEYQEHLKNATPYDIVHELILEDGTSKWIREKCETSYDEHGKPIVSNGVLHDITEQVLMEQDMKAKDKHMFYQSRLAQMGEMISMIAHQWRQPLAAIAATAIDLKIKMELEIYDLEKREDRDSFKDYLNSKLDNIEDFTQSLTATIDDFRDFYKPNKIFALVDINEPIQKTLNILKASLSTNNIALIENYNTNKKPSLLEREIMQVLLNIFKNAQDNFIYKDISEATIWIETQDTDEGVRLNICDNGGGISEDIILKIFDPYFSTKHDKNGTGLGLYMSKIIIEEHHGGSLRVKNEDDGVCFIIELPIGRKK